MANEELVATAKQLLTGILSNPNYNFTNINKAVDDAVAHAKALLNKLAVGVDGAAKEVDVVALKVEGAAEKVEAETAAPAPVDVPVTTAEIPASNEGGTNVGETEPK